MEKNMLVRLRPHDPKKGLLLKQYTYQGIRFQAGCGWYRVNGQVAAYLENVHSIPGDEDTPLAFDVCTPDEARAMDEKDLKAARNGSTMSIHDYDNNAPDNRPTERWERLTEVARYDERRRLWRTAGLGENPPADDAAFVAGIRASDRPIDVAVPEGWFATPNGPYDP